MEELRQRINQELVWEAKSFPINQFLKRDGSINHNKIKQLRPDFRQDAKNLIFINRALDAHGVFFGYEKLVFHSLNQLVEIWCPDHQDYFMQTARSHLEGNGCQKCRHRMVTRVTDYGSYTVPAYYHKFSIDGDSIIWYNKSSKLIKPLEVEDEIRFPE